jgi:hypothetical protein
MKKFLALSTAFVFAGISLAQPTQSDGSREQNPAFSQKHQRHIEWCKQNWDKCKERKLKWLSAKQECLQKSQSYEDFRSCVDQSRKQFREQMKQQGTKQ